MADLQKLKGTGTRDWNLVEVVYGFIGLGLERVRQISINFNCAFNFFFRTNYFSAISCLAGPGRLSKMVGTMLPAFLIVHQ